MKHCFSILFAATCLAGCLLSGCKEPEEPIPFTISQTQDLKIDSSEQTATVNVTAPEAWTAKSDEDWAVITASETSFRIAVSENPVLEERFCTITVTCGAEKLSFKLVQGGCPELFIVKYYEGMDPTTAEAIESGKSFTVSGAGDNLSFVVESNLPLVLDEAFGSMGYHAPVWTFDEKCDWISGINLPNMILNEYQITISIDANTTGEEREGTIDIVSSTGTNRVTIKIVQGVRDMVDNIFFMNPADWGSEDPAQIQYCVNGEAGVEYYTGLFDKEEFYMMDEMMNANLFLSFIQTTSGFMAGSGPIFTITEPGQTVTYLGTTAKYFMDMAGGLPIEAGKTYLICVCKKDDADNNNQEGEFYTIEYATPAAM